MPTVSVVIPTYRRPNLLPRAVDSVLKQSTDDWELIITDDEDPADEFVGETWTWLQTLTDPRIRILRNTGPHGQSGNVNSGLRAATGKWVKILFDDDALRPDCLKSLLASVDKQPTVVLASCAVAEYRDGVCVRSGERPGPLLVRVPQRYVHLGMYLQEEIGGGVPSQLMVRRDVLEKGVFFEDHPQLKSGVDAFWVARVLQHGDSLIVNQPLVEFYQGGHESVTSSMTDEALDAEFRVLRRIQLPMIDPSLHPPSLATIDQMLNLIRAANRFSKRNIGGAIPLILRSWRPSAWLLFFRFLRNRKRPLDSTQIPRIVVDSGAALR